MVKIPVVKCHREEMPVVKKSDGENAIGKKAIGKKYQMVKRPDGKNTTKQPFLQIFLCNFHIRNFGTRSSGT